MAVRCNILSSLLAIVRNEGFVFMDVSYECRGVDAMLLFTL